ncbi:MAG TPA: hypothetical protein VN660_13035 [Steroidobacteraceae bacterium]|nr:hypothetical protein [Steroidobacteraceae bacterium]
MMEDAAARRANYLARAIELRQMASQVQSAEMRDAFMRLAVLYEELAEYCATKHEPPEPEEKVR